MKKMIMAAAIAASFVAAPVFAQGYMGAGFGSASLQNAEGSFTGGGALTGGNAAKTSVKILGGYQITPNWGVEVQYTDLGKRAITAVPANAGINTNSIQASQFGVSATATYPIDAGFSLFGKLGVSANSSKVTDSAGGTSKESATSMSYGVGASYKFTPSIAVRAEYEDFGAISKTATFNNSKIKGNNFSLALLYSF